MSMAGYLNLHRLRQAQPDNILTCFFFKWAANLGGSKERKKCKVERNYLVFFWLQAFEFLFGGSGDAPFNGSSFIIFY